MRRITMEEYIDSFKTAERDVPDTNVGDLISRQAALNWCHPDDWDTPDERWRPESEFGRFLQSLPSAEKHGKWIGVSLMVDTEECSLCGFQILSSELETPYCPLCGAHMEISEE